MIAKKLLIGQTVIVSYMENTDSDILGLGITSSLMWISNRGHVSRVSGVRLHPNGVFSNVLMQNKRHESRTTSDLSKKVIVPYMIDADNDIMFTIKVFEMKFCMVVYGERRHCLTICEPVTVGNTKVIADPTI